MKIITRFKSLDEKFPGRIYIFNSDFETSYGTPEQAVRHYRDTISGITEKPFDWVNAIMWGNGDNKMIDFFGYKLGEHWRTNPDVFAWVTEGGKTLENKTPNEITCGKGLIVLGAEESYRGVSTMLGYFRDPPRSDILNVEMKFEDLAKSISEPELEQIWKFR